MVLMPVFDKSQKFLGNDNFIFRFPGSQIQGKLETLIDGMPILNCKSKV